MYLQQL